MQMPELHTFFFPRSNFFSMQGNLYLNAEVHKTGGIKRLLTIQDAYDVLKRELLMDFYCWLDLFVLGIRQKIS